MNDELSRNVGKSRADSMGWEYVLASGPVGGSHYLIPEIRGDGSPESLGVNIVALQRPEPYDCHAGFARRQARTCGMPVLFGERVIRVTPTEQVAFTK